MRYALLPLFGLAACAVAGLPVSSASEHQITNSQKGHMLTNISVWSRDGEWVVYDTRKSPQTFDGTRIEEVNAMTGEVRCLYESKNGAACGVVTYHPTEKKVVFIHGPENPTPDWAYGFSRRRGAVVDLAHPGKAEPLDAMNYAPPFSPGALRGGSHVHIFSGDGRYVSFTYDDEVISHLNGDGPDHDANQRNIGVSMPGHQVKVNHNHPRNNDGTAFSVLVTRTVAHPRPGSDEISRACEEGWIGQAGYLRPDGTRQAHALAFQGLVTAANGQEHYEVFVVDLPADLTLPDGAPLEGTATRRPAPPAGTIQRRITFTDSRPFPGIQGPRHWLRASPDGSQIAFLMKDHAGIVQFWAVSPNGGEPRQITRNQWDVASAFTWSSDGKRLAYVMDNSVFYTEVATGESIRLTPRSPDNEAPQSYACVFSPDGTRIAYARTNKSGFDQLFFASVTSASSSR